MGACALCKRHNGSPRHVATQCFAKTINSTRHTAQQSEGTLAQSLPPTCRRPVLPAPIPLGQPALPIGTTTSGDESSSTREDVPLMCKHLPALHNLLFTYQGLLLVNMTTMAHPRHVATQCFAHNISPTCRCPARPISISRDRLMLPIDTTIRGRIHHQTRNLENV